MKVSAVICAAGNGRRAGTGRSKLLSPLRGAPVIWHTLKAFSSADEIVVPCRECDMEEMKAVCGPFGAKVCLGGETRTRSVYEALKLVTGDVVLIHDGARPFVTKETIAGCLDSVREHGSGICAVPATDTVAVLGDGDVIASVPGKDGLVNVQTPQGFLTKDIKAAYETAVSLGREYPDDGSLYKEFCGDPHVCGGDRSNVKITYPEDLREYGVPFSGCGNVGFGVDVHAFADGDGVTLCGVRVPCDRRLVAHSDGDVPVHALIDALLSAAGMRDIGHLFPDTDDEWLGASGLDMLERTRDILSRSGYVPHNVSLSIQAEKPRLSPYVGEMAENVRRVLRLPEGRVAVAAGTCEGLGFVGEGLGIAAYCAVTMEEKTGKDGKQD